MKLLSNLLFTVLFIPLSAAGLNSPHPHEKTFEQSLPSEDLLALSHVTNLLYLLRDNTLISQKELDLLQKRKDAIQKIFIDPSDQLEILTYLVYNYASNINEIVKQLKTVLEESKISSRAG